MGPNGAVNWSPRFTDFSYFFRGARYAQKYNKFENWVKCVENTGWHIRMHNVYQLRSVYKSSILSPQHLIVQQEKTITFEKTIIVLLDIQIWI